MRPKYAFACFESDANLIASNILPLISSKLGTADKLDVLTLLLFGMRSNSKAEFGVEERTPFGDVFFILWVLKRIVCSGYLHRVIESFAYLPTNAQNTIPFFLTNNKIGTKNYCNLTLNFKEFDCSSLEQRYNTKKSDFLLSVSNFVHC